MPLGQVVPFGLGLTAPPRLLPRPGHLLRYRSTVSYDGSANDSDITDGERYSVVQHRRKKRNRRETSPGTDSVIMEDKLPSAPRLTLLVSPGVPASTCNNLKPSTLVNSLVLGKIYVIRADTPKTVTAADTKIAGASATVPLQTSLGGFAGRAYRYHVALIAQ